LSLLHDLLVLLGLAHDDPPTPLQVVLFDPSGRRMPSAPFVVTVAGEDRPGVADETGLASAGDAPSSGTVTVKWRRRPEDYPSDLAPLASDDYEHSAEVTVVLDSDPQKATEQRLANLGYFGGAALADSVTAFQRDHALATSGDPADADFQAELLREHDGLQVVRTPRFPPPDPAGEEES
jgi:hypothetical protein